MIQKTAEEKILAVLEVIKDQYDLSPKKSYATAGGAYYHRHPEGEIRIDTAKLLRAGGIDFYELEKILAKIEEDGLIETSQVLPDYI